MWPSYAPCLRFQGKKLNSRLDSGVLFPTRHPNRIFKEDLFVPSITKVFHRLSDTFQMQNPKARSDLKRGHPKVIQS